jgi:hydroxyacylglutathione hydrolase
MRRRRLACFLSLAVALLVVVVLTGCATSSVVGRTPAGAEIVQIPLRLSNVYLVKTARPILVDTGTVGDMDDLSRALADNGVALTSIAVVILTHGHADHAGLAAEIQHLSLAKVFLGEGDVPLAQNGHNDVLRPTGLVASLIKPLIPDVYAEFSPDVVVRDPIDLARWGIDGTLMEMPGHTPGSLVIVMNNHAAFVGDMLRGGTFGGAAEHYFHADRAANRRNIEALLRMGVERFYVGHGAPVSRADVMKAFDLR